MKRRHQTGLIRFFAYCLYFCTFSGCITIYIRRYIFQIIEPGYNSKVTIILICIRTVAMIEDFSVALLFFHLFKFFAIKKLETMANMNRKIKVFPHWFMIIWSFCLYGLYVLALFAKWICAPIGLQKEYSGKMLVFYEFYRYVLLTFIDISVGITMLY